MITRINVRHFLPEMAPLAGAMANLLRGETGFEIVEIDHTRLTLDDFDLQGAEPVSIDRHLASKFQIPYVQVSRMFDPTGRVMARKIVVPQGLPSQMCVIDTDIVSGETIRRACGVVGTTHYSVPLTLGDFEDLIDVEDLAMPISLLTDETYCTYLLNEEFFSRRTSLPVSLYPRINRLVGSMFRDLVLTVKRFRAS